MSFRVRSLIVPTALLAMACVLATTAVADTISDIEQFVPSGTAGTVIDGNNGVQGQYPVITYVLSQPGTIPGTPSRTYSTPAYLVNDGTGSLEVFSKTPSSNSTFTPAPGLAITATGTYSPYNQIPELGTLTGINQVSSGNAVPAPTLTDIPDVNQSPLESNLAGQYLEIQNVTISGFSGAGNPAVAFTANNSPSSGTSISDGTNSMTLYYWPSSYSMANANLANRQIPSPTTMVDVYGIVDVFGTGATATPEFVPINITNADGSSLPAAVPEPGTLALLGAGLAVAAVAFIRRKVSK